MYYGALKKCDIANGAGVRVTLFVSGCTNHCPDCFQPQTWDFPSLFASGRYVGKAARRLWGLRTA